MADKNQAPFSVDDMVRLMKEMSKSGLKTVEYKDGDFSLKLEGQEVNISVGPQTAVQVQAPSALPVVDIPDENEGVDGQVVKSPLVGVFYSAPKEGAEPFVKVGDTVTKGQKLAIIEAMKMMNEIESDFDGVVSEILVSNGQSVEYGQELFVIR